MRETMGMGTAITVLMAGMMLLMVGGERGQPSLAAADIEHAFSIQRYERGDRCPLDAFPVAPLHRATAPACTP